MKLPYRYAIVSFCSDLTVGDAPSVPVAILLVADAGTHMHAAVVGYYPLEAEDPITAALLKDTPAFIGKQVDEAWNRSEVADLEHLLCALQHSMRNTLYVSSVSEEAVMEEGATSPEAIGVAVYSNALSLFFDTLKKAGLLFIPAPTSGPLHVEAAEDGAVPARSATRKSATRRPPSIPPARTWALEGHPGRRPALVEAMSS